MARKAGLMPERNPSRVEQALAWLQSGEPSSVERAIAALQQAVFSFGMKLCGNPADAEDTAQETLVRLARSLKKFPNTRALSVWLYKVAKSQCLMSRRRSKFAPAQTLSLDELMPTPGEVAGNARDVWPRNPEELVLQQELRDQLQRAVLDLPEPYRLVLVLRDMEQLATAEVARILGVSESTVKMRLHRARVFVRNALDRHLQSVAAEVKSEDRPTL